MTLQYWSVIRLQNMPPLKDALKLISLSQNKGYNKPLWLNPVQVIQAQFLVFAILWPPISSTVLLKHVLGPFKSPLHIYVMHSTPNGFLVNINLLGPYNCHGMPRNLRIILVSCPSLLALVLVATILFRTFLRDFGYFSRLFVLWELRVFWSSLALVPITRLLLNKKRKY